MDRLKPVFVLGFGLFVVGLVSLTITAIAGGMIVMALAVCTVEIVEAIGENK